MLMRENSGNNRKGLLLRRSASGQNQSGVLRKKSAVERSGRLFNNPAPVTSPKPSGQDLPVVTEKVEQDDPYRFAFITLWVFTLTLYVRPNDLIPMLGAFPIAKLIAITAVVAYISAQTKLGKPIINRTIEAKMIYLLLFLSIIFIPSAVSPQDSITLLTETFIKTVIIFMMMIGAINTTEKLHSLLKLVVVCGSVMAFYAIRSYMAGHFTDSGLRIEGLVGGMFANANDLAAALDMLMPVALALGLTSSGLSRLFYFICAGLMAGGVLATFSRGGFLGFMAVIGLLVWKFGRGHKIKTLLIAPLGLAAILTLLPGSYLNRITTIMDTKQDQTGSAQERTELMKRAAEVAMRRPVVGIGLGNFHIYSHNEHVAHNAYLEVAAELGLIGLIAYLIIIFAPLRGLKRVENECLNSLAQSDRNKRYLSIGLQAHMVAYIVTSFFLSIQYLWYLYYAAAFAIVLRQIHAAGVSAETVTRQVTQIALLPKFHNVRGILWKSDRLHKGAR
jgi:O-antigen ligase